MHRDIRRRLAALEARQHVGRPKIRVWVNKGDGLICSPTGEVMTQEAFDAAFPTAMKFRLNIGMPGNPTGLVPDMGLSTTEGRGSRLD